MEQTQDSEWIAPPAPQAVEPVRPLVEPAGWTPSPEQRTRIAR
jgi:hypothetical protein